MAPWLVPVAAQHGSVWRLRAKQRVNQTSCGSWVYHRRRRSPASPITATPSISADAGSPTVTPVSENDALNAVTLRRADYEALLSAAEDVADAAVAGAHRLHEARVGWETARATYLTWDEGNEPSPANVP